MTAFDSNTPVVLSFTNHDPSGCGGLHADIETAASLGAHCATVICSLLASDTQSLKEVVDVEPALIIEQARALLEDMPVKAIKIGMLSEVEAIEAVHTILADYPDIPVVFHPSYASLHGIDDEEIVNATQTLLLPQTTVMIARLGRVEAFTQSADTIDACAQEILEHGCEHLLLTSTDDSATHFHNSLYDARGLNRHFTYEKCHRIIAGSSETLAAAIATYLAHGLLVTDAVAQGQQFAWQAMHASRRLGMGRETPNRFYWATGERNSSGETH